MSPLQDNHSSSILSLFTVSSQKKDIVFRVIYLCLFWMIFQSLLCLGEFFFREVSALKNTEIFITCKMYNICLCSLNCYCKIDFFLQKGKPAYQLKFRLTVEIPVIWTTQFETLNYSHHLENNSKIFRLLVEFTIGAANCFCPKKPLSSWVFTVLPLSLLLWQCRTINRAEWQRDRWTQNSVHDGLGV